jgi:lipoprotein NlpI
MRFRFWIAVAFIVLWQAGPAMAEGNGDFGDCVAHYLQRDYDNALMLCTRALQSGDLSDRQTVNALNARGLAYFGKGEYEAAIKDLDRAIRMKPDDDSAYNNRGMSYIGKGDYDRALQDFNQAIRLSPDDESGYLGRASAYANQGENDRAIESFDQAIQVNPDSTYASLWRAQFLFQLARFHDAADALKTLVNAHPKFTEGVLWLALVQRRAGNRADDVLKARAPELDLETWPGPVVRFYLDQITGTAVQVAAGDPNPRTATRQSCEATFYIAELELSSGNTAAAKPGFQVVVDSCPKSSVVVRIARAELGRI